MTPAASSPVDETCAAHPLSAYDVLSPACPSRTVLRHVVDRWTPLIVAVLAEGPRRFGQLREAVGGVTPKVLTQTLRSMERDGLLTREQTPGVPPRVDYMLTPLGAGLAEPIAALRAWAEDNAEQVLANREVYDRSHPQPQE
ncbi:helix-turn-helix domain-containing protein [Actinomyces sp. MRS3W]|uniref:winged helix-turn-helix transcriptional regulator n=1 Tax=Actinomyces sp. MRS3W TaxID=2800796 RepID=UPI0028FD4ECB|nr:helix-turn-helix domain-containing protein [Actinomyces sp. MRS3W]MDU0349375.1 helix-turn-helix domain-containing protein [Actinomyces sp. MRS3W]